MVKPYQSYNRFEPKLSPVTALVAGAATIDVPLDPSRPHSFAGAVFFNDATGETPVQPTDGKIVYTVQLTVQPHVFQDIPDNEVDATSPGQVDWAGNTDVVRADVQSVVGATHVRIIVVGNSA